MLFCSIRANGEKFDLMDLGFLPHIYSVNPFSWGQCLDAKIVSL